jgi:hypothetical protein
MSFVVWSRLYSAINTLLKYALGRLLRRVLLDRDEQCTQRGPGVANTVLQSVLI